MEDADVEAEPEALGTVIVNLQRTQMDRLASLRIFGRIDEVALLLAEELQLPLPKLHPAPQTTWREAAEYLIPAVWPEFLGAPEADVFEVPYDARGCRFLEGEALPARTRLDLTEGSRLLVTDGLYAGDEGEVLGRSKEGIWRIRISHEVKKGFEAKVPLVLGWWWVEAALRGSLSRLPVVTAN